MKKSPNLQSDKSPEWFDKWCRRAKMKPVCKVHDKDGAVMIADSGKAIDIGGKLYIRTGYAIERNGAQIGATHEYDPIQFFRDGPKLGQERRVNEALDAARKLKRQLDQVGFWPERVHG